MLTETMEISPFFFFSPVVGYRKYRYSIRVDDEPEKSKTMFLALINQHILASSASRSLGPVAYFWADCDKLSKLYFVYIRPMSKSPLCSRFHL